MHSLLQLSPMDNMDGYIYLQLKNTQQLRGRQNQQGYLKLFYLNKLLAFVYSYMEW